MRSFHFFLTVACSLAGLGLGSAAANAAGAEARASVTRSYLREDFDRINAEFSDWNRRYSAAPSGSWDERYADQRRRAAMHDGLDLLQRPGAFEGLRAQEVESFAADLDHQYALTPSDSMAETFYNQSRGIAWRAYEESARELLRCARHYRELEDAAVDADLKYRRAPSGSLSEGAYTRVRNLLLAGARDRLALEMRDMSTMELERMASEYDAHYRRAASGSALEGYYASVRDLAADELHRRFP